MYLAITLARLEDFDNACAAMEKALELEDDMLFHLNYGEEPLWPGRRFTALVLLPALHCCPQPEPRHTFMFIAVQPSFWQIMARQA